MPKTNNDKEFRSRIEIPLKKADSRLCIYEEQENSLSVISEDEASLNCESVWQLLESHSYGYYFTNSLYSLKEIKGIISRTKIRDTNAGRITPRIYAGTLTLEVVKESDPGKTIDTVDLEILPTKLDISTGEQDPDSDYREKYRTMLDDIASRCTELIMQMNSPVSQRFEPDFERESLTIYQRFSFVKSLVLSSDFTDALNLILYAPAARWKEISELTDIRRIRRFGSGSLKQIASGTRRISYSLNDFVDSVPVKIIGSRKTETVDIPENRFIKHALEVFLKFCENCLKRFEALNNHKASAEARQLISVIRNYLDMSFFRGISRPETLQLNSPLLQRKNGYREVLNAWILFSLAARLIWKGGDQVYRAGKRDIAVLYEYWLFFRLYELFLDKFEPDKNANENKRTKVPAFNDLIEETSDGMGLKLKSGKETSIYGKTKDKTRQLRALFSYNRTYSGDTIYESDGSSWTAREGSWTKPLRPDYTLSLWPSVLTRYEAEEEDMIVHIHFDAKYKIKRFKVEVDVKKEQADDEEESDSGEKQSDSLEKEKMDERKGIYKNADLMKMHAYRDAIRRTGGSYILYPGVGDPSETNSVFKGFHEIIPGLGAFAIRPSKDKSGTGIDKLSLFIDEVIQNFQDRANQRERLSSKVYDIHENKKDESQAENDLSEPLPEYLDAARSQKLIPDETSVLIGYYLDQKHLDWIISEKKYNGRTGRRRGAMDLTPEIIGARYLILHTKKEKVSGRIYKIIQSENQRPNIALSSEAIFNKYPHKKDVVYSYLVFNIEEAEEEFRGKIWRVSDLPNYSPSLDAFPFTCTITELMRVTEK